MRAIMFADANSIHTYMNIKEIMMEAYEEVYIVSLYSIKNREYIKFYQENNIKVYDFSRKAKNKFSYTFEYLANINAVKRMGKFDACFVHFLDGTTCKFVARCCEKFKKIIAVYWGSDLLRMTDWKKRAQKKLFNKADYIRAGELYSVEKFKEIYGDQYNKKIVTLNFFVNSNINAPMQLSDEQYRTKFMIKNDKISVLIGYNGSRSQNHLKVIENIALLDDDIKTKCQWVFFMSYSDMSTEKLIYYKKEVSDKCRALGLDFIILEKFLSKLEMIELARAIDVFIHFIVSDSFSGTLIEMLCNDVLVIKGSWLKYYEFDSCTMINSDYDKLAKDITDAINNFDEYHKACEKNKETVLSFSDNRAIKNEWLDFIDKRL